MVCIVWDEPKRIANFAKHGLDFADVETKFEFETALAIESAPSATGRRRYRLIGLLDDAGVVVMVVSPLGNEALSVISLRPASQKERTLYGE